MKATELIGKRAVRTVQVDYGNGNISRSFMEDPIEIVKATDTHIFYRFCDYFSHKPKGAVHTVAGGYCDDNWIDYDELTKDIQPIIENGYREDMKKILGDNWENVLKEREKQEATS